MDIFVEYLTVEQHGVTRIIKYTLDEKEMESWTEGQL